MKNEIDAPKKLRLEKKKRTGTAALMDRAMSDLETFWWLFQSVKSTDRMSVMPAFHLAQLTLQESSLGASYVVDRLARLEKICKAMIDPTNPFNFGEECAIASGSVEVRLIRLELRCRRLIPST